MPSPYTPWWARSESFIFDLRSMTRTAAEGGYIHIADRKREMIISGDDNICRPKSSR